jgi:hypothetical protein
MDRMKKFLKDYWPWLVVGVIVGCIVAILIWYFYSEKEDEMKGKEEEDILITQPYTVPKHDVQIALESKEKDFDSQESVFKISRPDEGYIEKLRVFFEIPNRIDPEENFSMEYKDNIISYNSNLAIVSLLSKQGGFRNSINSIEEAKSLLSEYLDIKTVNDIQENSDGIIRYKGQIEIEGKGVGTPYLNSYGYILTVNKGGQVNRLQLLTINDLSVVSTFEISTMKLSEILNISDYPMLVLNTDIEERFYNKPSLIRASAYLNSLSVKDIKTGYMFNSFNKSSYILPTYKLKGSGQVVDSQGGKYWSDSEVYICGVHTQYLEDVDEEVIIFDPVPFVPIK